MASLNFNSPKIILPPSILSFPALFRATAGMDAEEGKEPKYEATFIVKPAAQKTPEFKALVEAIQACVKEVGWEKVSYRKPLRKGEEKTHLGGYEEGDVFFKATSKRRPQVIGPDMASLTEDDIWAGCLVRASVWVFPYDFKGKGIGLRLGNVQLIKEGERLGGGGSSAEDDFGPVAGTGAGADLADLLS